MINNQMKAGLGIISLIALAGIFAPFLTHYDPVQFNLAQKLLTPSSQHFLGTDGNGSDILARLLFGARLSLRIAFVVVAVSTLIGLAAGSLAGYYGGLIDQIVMRVLDMLQAFPGFLLALAIIAFMGTGVNNLIFALCITGWAGYAKLIRGEIQNLKTRDFVAAAHALGGSDFLIIVRHLWPNVLAVLSVQMTFGLAATVISEAGLSFLGLGAPPNEPSWGSLLGSGRKYLIDAPHVSVFPGLAIMFLVLGFNLLGDGLRRRVDPKS
jgi:peptide/nickel transport system permease protein